MENYFKCLAEKALIANETRYTELQKTIFEFLKSRIGSHSSDSSANKLEQLHYLYLRLATGFSTFESPSATDDPEKLRDGLQATFVTALTPVVPASGGRQTRTLRGQIEKLIEQVAGIEQLLNIVDPQMHDWGWSKQIAYLGRKYEIDELREYDTGGPTAGTLSRFLIGCAPSDSETETQASPSPPKRPGRQDLNRFHDVEDIVKCYVPLIARRLAAELTLSKRITKIFTNYGFSAAAFPGQDPVAELAKILSGNEWPPDLRPNAPADEVRNASVQEVRKNFEHWPRAAIGGSFAQALASALDFRPSAWALAQELECQQIDCNGASSSHASPPAAESRLTPTDEAWQAGLLGLAFSGGGIRSATFNLGILQGLASLGLLRKFNYLSTVSGGGYIGAWLINWIKRKGVDEVERRLCPGATPDPRDLRLEPIRFLRDFSNYLTPQLGLLSADLWVMVVVWVRNTLLNLLVLLPAILAVLLIPRVPELWAQSIARACLTGFDCGFSDKYRLYVPLPDLYLFAMLACVVWASYLIALNLRQFPADTNDIGTADVSQRQSFYSRPWGVLTFIVAPIFVGAWFASIELWVHAGDEGYWEWTTAGLWGAIMAAVILWIAKYPHRFGKDPDRTKLTLQGLSAMAVIVVTIGAVTALLTMGLESIFAFWRGNDLPNVQSSSAVTVFGVPLIVLALFFILLLLAGFMSQKLPDGGSKWLVRLRAYIAIYSSIWLAWTGIAIYGPWLYYHLLHLWYAKLPLIAAWLWTTVKGVLAGKSAETRGGKADWKTSLGFYATVGPYVFIVGLFLAMSVAAQLSLIGLTEHLSQTGPDQSWITRLLPCEVIHHEWAWSLWIILVLSAFLSFWLSFWFDVNEFSLNKFYRSRLVRCYLGASNDDRKPNPFTGFDPADDQLALSWFKKICEPDIDRKDPFPGYDGPFPIFNATLNLVHGDELAWQERRGASFVFTPELCGYETPWHAPAHPQPFQKLEFLGYRETDKYAYPKPGMHLGIPMSVSGAALSPNMGFYSRAATGFLMTIFNARLGWWFGNPRHKKTWRRAGPTQGLAYLTKELLGLTNDRAAFVYVSDGGHFENLAIYELVRRRCRYIVACDGEEDATLAFNGLGNAIRKCRMDFGVEIDIGVDMIKPESAAVLSRSHCVVGTIQYPDQVGLGYLVYLKASIVGNEPEDVLQYRVAHSAFPHQSTGDQWFTESQFESYRRLGLHVAETTFQRAVGDLKNQSEDLNQKLFEQLRDNWFPPVKAIQTNFTRHAQALDALVREMRADPILIKLDHMLIPTRDADLPEFTDDDKPKIFLFLSSVIQLMENIYIDLDLESNADHPHCAGWIQIFQAWAEVEIFQKAWGRYGWTYGRNFQRFCSRRLGLSI